MTTDLSTGDDRTIITTHQLATLCDFFRFSAQGQVPDCMTTINILFCCYCCLYQWPITCNCTCQERQDARHKEWADHHFVAKQQKSADDGTGLQNHTPI